MSTRQKFTPRPYQTLIIDHILNGQRVAVWAGMGTGKTVATLSALEILQMVEDGPALVGAPLRVATTTWPEEVLKWEHLKGMNVVPIVGTERERIAAVRSPSQVYTTNYEQHGKETIRVVEVCDLKQWQLWTRGATNTPAVFQRWI